MLLIYMCNNIDFASRINDQIDTKFTDKFKNILTTKFINANISPHFLHHRRFFC